MRSLTIISGGQSGVDRAALDTAIALSLPYRGWCPRGGWAEDFPHPPGLLPRYPLLRETPLEDPAQRTRWNVRDSDATLILVMGGLALSAGTTLTLECAKDGGKPLLVLNLGDPGSLARAKIWLAGLLAGEGSFCLNIAGPRESEAPGVYVNASALLQVVLASSA